MKTQLSACNGGAAGARAGPAHREEKEAATTEEEGRCASSLAAAFRGSGPENQLFYKDYESYIVPLKSKRLPGCLSQ